MSKHGLTLAAALLLAGCTGLKGEDPPDGQAGADGAVPGGSGGASGGDGGPRCTARASSACFEDHLHWFDSCGARGELRQTCDNGCRGSSCVDDATGGAGGSGGTSGSDAGGSGSGGTDADGGSAAPAPRPDGAECDTGDQCTSTYCIGGRCSTPSSCDAAACDGGRTCMAGDLCACPTGTFVDGACCGDGVTQTREGCDDGGANSDSAANACRTSCEPASCGDGVKDSGEACDLGGQNSDTAADRCRTSCAAAGCGDGVIDTGEDCDDDNTTAGDGCSAACKPEVVAIDAGGSHACGLFGDGRLKCWGDNSAGQLGVDATAYGNRDAVLGNAAGEMGASLPVVLVGVSAFSLHGRSTCAVSGEQLYCWGANLNGFIRGSPTSDVAAPLRVDVGAAVKAVAVTEEHGCVLTTGNTVRCWGNNTDGQLATGNETPIYPVSGVAAAVTIDLGATAKAVAAGGRRSCALLANDTLKCWGDNFNGALGIGSTAAEWGSMAGQTSPLAVTFSGGFALAQLSLGGYHSCAVSGAGKARCWGENEYGKLGIGSTTASNVPSADLALVGPVQQVEAGSASTIALMSSGRVRVWGVGGSDLHGRPGVASDVGNNPGEIEVLQDIDLGTGVLARSVALGSGFACALTRDARVKCWGANASGELGHGGTQPRGAAAGDMGDNLPYSALE